SFPLPPSSLPLCLPSRITGSSPRLLPGLEEPVRRRGALLSALPPLAHPAGSASLEGPGGRLSSLQELVRPPPIASRHRGVQQHCRGRVGAPQDLGGCRHIPAGARRVDAQEEPDGLPTRRGSPSAGAGRTLVPGAPRAGGPFLQSG
ncbi:hypothetical protein NDU88_001304, partial [Pleurodeles waltl]